MRLLRFTYLDKASIIGTNRLNKYVVVDCLYLDVHRQLQFPNLRNIRTDLKRIPSLKDMFCPFVRNFIFLSILGETGFKFWI